MSEFDHIAVKSNCDVIRSLAIPITDGNGIAIGRLCCVDRARSTDPGIIKALTAWRNMNRAAFLTQFEATESRTANWLNDVVIPAKDRLLFLIVDADDRLIGNVGIANIRREDAELDNVLRGAISQHRGLVRGAINSLIAWAYLELGLNKIYLNVFANNLKAITLYESLGFVMQQERKLSVLRTAKEVKYLVQSEEGDPVPYGYIQMVHRRK